MPLREQTPSALIISLVAVALAMLAGLVVALAGSRSNAGPLEWTPPAPTVIVATFTAPAATTTPAAAASPTRAASPTATPPPPTTRPVPSVTRPNNPSPPPAVTPSARIRQGPTNMRAGPGTNYDVVAIAKEGAVFALNGRSADGAWLQVCCAREAPAWVAAELAELPSGIEIPVVK